MEDLWGSPWASDLPSAHAKLDDFPAAPQTVHFGSTTHHQQHHQHHQQPQQHQHHQHHQHSLPRKISQNLSPWHDDDAWGDVQGAGQRWRRSPGLKAVDGFGGGSLKRDVSPDPWKALDNAHFETRATPQQQASFVPIVETKQEALRKDEGADQNHQTEDHKAQDAPSVAQSMMNSDILEMRNHHHVWAAEHDTPRTSVEPELTKSSSEAGESSTEESGREDDDDEDTGGEPQVDIKDDQTDSDQAEEEVDFRPETHQVKAKPVVFEKDALPAPKPSMLFPIDFSLLDTLFPSTGPIDTRPEPLPDTIIDNTFTTTGERKTWYRISRFGSRRKHDSGMDDNYIRVSWAGSQIHDRTLKTVQRWMEQDALTGRPHIGGRPGANGASLFNWDSKAPPVEIDQLLEKKAAQAKHTRHSSLVPAATTGSEEMGWADSPPASPVTAKPKQRPVSMIQLATTAMPNPWADSSPALKFAPAVSSPLRTTSPARPSNLKNVEIADNSEQVARLDPPPDHDNGHDRNNSKDIHDDGNENEDDEDEDEWGEMVGTSSTPGDGGNIFGPLSETARASLESFKDDVFAGESPQPVDKPQPPDIADLPSSASTIWDVSHPEDGVSPSPLASAPASPSVSASANDGERSAPAAFPFPVTPPITPAPGTPTTWAAPREGISIDNANRKASLAQAIAMSSPAMSVSDRDVDLERGKDARLKQKEKDKFRDKDDDMDAVVAEILRNLPDLTYMLR